MRPAPAVKVSIITPAYRAESFIAQAVRSVLAQTYTDWEMIIIADDGVDYRHCLENQGISDPRLRFVSTGGVATGCPRARNVGLAAAEGPIIAMLDADDAFFPRKLERMAPMALRYGVCVSALDYVHYRRGDRHLIRRVGERMPDGELSASTYLNVQYSGNAMLVFDRHKISSQWREDLPAMEDFVFAMSVFNHVSVIHHLQETLHEYVYTANSMSTGEAAANNFVLAKQRVLALLDRGDLGVSQPDAVQAFRCFLTVSLATEYAYIEALRKGESITFLELLEKNLPA